MLPFLTVDQASPSIHMIQALSAVRPLKEVIVAGLANLALATLPVASCSTYQYTVPEPVLFVPFNSTFVIVAPAGTLPEVILHSFDTHSTPRLLQYSVQQALLNNNLLNR